MENENKFLTIGELAKILNCKIGIINKLRKQEKIPYIKIGSLVRYDKAEVIKQLKQNTKDDYF